mgnify:CR=1 FL=1
MSEQSMVVCHFCGSEKVNENDLCYGCGICICVECVQKYPAPSGKHSPEDHRSVPDYDPFPRDQYAPWEGPGAFQDPKEEEDDEFHDDEPGGEDQEDEDV